MPHRFRTLAGVSIAVLLIASAALGATPPSVTVTPGSTVVTYTSALIGGFANDGGLCVDGVSCDTVGVVVAAGDYTGKNLRLAIDWLVPANDFDEYMFAGGLGGQAVGASHGPPPSTHEEIILSLNRIVPVAQRYVIHVVASASTPEQVNGRLDFVAPPAPRVALTAPADVRFSPNVTVLAPGAGRDCEPSIRVDVRGNAYVGGIRGVPAGVDLWRFDLSPASAAYDPQLRSPAYLGQPDAFAPADTGAAVGGKDGGGDIDIATAFPADGSTPALTIVSLAAANISSAVSTDRGDHFALSPAVADAPADDRQWVEADGSSTVYQMYRAPIPATGLWVQKSTDHGVNWGAASLVSPTGTTPGYIDIDHRNGAVYVSHLSGSAVFVSRSGDGGTTWTTSTVDNSTSHGNLFDPIKVGDDGASTSPGATDATSISRTRPTPAGTGARRSA